MPDWFQNPHADIVIAAYAVAAIVLIGLAAASWIGYAHNRKQWNNWLDKAADKTD